MEIRHSLCKGSRSTESRLLRAHQPDGRQRRQDNKGVHMITKIKNRDPGCPFCGSRDTEMFHLPDSPAHSRVFCKKCGAQGPIAIGSRATFEAWETRLPHQEEGESS